jgi:hypothetical protein
LSGDFLKKHININKLALTILKKVRT